MMLVTTLVAMHSHSPWSSLLRARNWRLPLGRVLCLLLLGFPTLAKQGGKEEGRSRVAGEESGRAGEKRSHQHLRGRRRGWRGQCLSTRPAPPQAPLLGRPSRSHPDSTAPGPSEQTRLLGPSPPPCFSGAPEPRGTFLHVMTGKGSPAAAQGISSSRPASCLYSQPGSTVKYGGS